VTVALERHRMRSEHVVVWLEPLQALAVAGGNGHGGMEAEAGFARAVRLGFGVSRGELIELDPVTEAEQALTRTGARGDAAL
jgi:hypothetical protein